MILPVETNIIIFNVQEPYTAPALSSKVERTSYFSVCHCTQQVRLVLHLDITPQMVEQTIAVENYIIYFIMLPRINPTKRGLECFTAACATIRNYTFA